MKKKVLLFNPPSLTKQKFSRDYFCSKTLKGDYVEQPLDLLFLSGILFDEFDVSVLDATVLGLTRAQSLEKIDDLNPEAIIFLSGTASFALDAQCMRQIRKKNPDVLLIGIGDVFFVPGVFESSKWIDAVLTDFTSCDIADFIAGRYRGEGAVVVRGQTVARPERLPESHEFSVPNPRHEMFLPLPFTFPFARRLPFATVLTDYGCPHSCPFCINSTFGYKIRTKESLVAEFDYLHSLGIKELFFRDQTFCSDRNRFEWLCGELSNGKWNFSWTAFARPDQIDEEFLSIIKRAGCHSLIIGTETAEDESINGKAGKEFGKDMVRHAFSLCRRNGIETIGTVMIGLPGQTYSEVIETIEFMTDIDCDFAAFNCFVPKPATGFVSGIDYCAGQVCDQSGRAAVYGNGQLESAEIDGLMRLARRRFYLRPTYLLRRIFKLRSLTQFRNSLKNGLSFLSS